MAAVSVDSFAFRECRSHAIILLRSEARVRVLKHRAAFRAGRNGCEKCARGQRLHAWRCAVIGGPHWHVGHAPGGS
jgi:hypothetical protein